MPLIDFEDEDYSPSEPAADETAKRLVLQVPLSMAGMRLDQALAMLLPDQSRSRLSSLVKRGLVRLDDAPSNPKAKLKGNEKIDVELQPRDEDLAFTPEEIALDILFEDDHVIVINKPAGLVVHPAAGNWQGTLLNGLLHHIPGASQLARAGIVHRLDKDTSGVMVAAKTETAQLNLIRQLQARTVKREYLALAQGEVDENGTVDAAIGRHSKVRVKMAIVEEEKGGKSAVTHYTVAENFSYHTLLECRLETGRTHQIRVHLQSIGYPIEGDQVYGATLRGIDKDQREILNAFTRQALHARRLTFVHPATHKPVVFEADMPTDMQGLIDEVATW